MKPYINLILSGEKTIECRLTKQARAPFDAIDAGERIYFKQSAGPWGLTAVCDHALFEDNLCPARVRELQRDYNEFIRGDNAYWESKQDARYISLIWLRDIEPIDTGPGIKPLQGAAWVSISAERDLQEEPALEPSAARGAEQTPDLCFAIEITEGNLRNNSLYVTRVIDRFPAWSIGGRNRSESARPITLLLRDGPRIETDIVGPRKLFRRRAWGEWYRTVGAEPGDQVVFTPLDEATFFVGLKPHSRGRLNR